MSDRQFVAKAKPAPLDATSIDPDAVPAAQVSHI
jgi:hypothetical protein